MLFVVSGRSATASEEQEAPLPTFAPRETAVHARLGTPLLGSHGRTTRAAVHSHRARRRGAPLRLVRYGVCFGGVLLQGLVTGAFLWPIDGVRCVCCGRSLKAWPRTDAGGTTRPGLDRLVASNERARRSFSTKGVPRSRTCRYGGWGYLFELWPLEQGRLCPTARALLPAVCAALWLFCAPAAALGALWPAHLVDCLSVCVRAPVACVCGDSDSQAV